VIDPFEYQPPNAATAPKYAAIREAERVATAACIDSMNVGAWRGRTPTNDDKQAAFIVIGHATKALHDLIERECPPCADTTAALRCVRLARMAANEVVAGPADIDVGGIAAQCGDNLRAARWQACAAVALNTPTPEP
jgi:hypothetical protein